MVEKLLAAAGETRAVVTPYQAVERFLPVDGQALQFLEKLAVEQGCGSHGGPTPPTRVPPLRG